MNQQPIHTKNRTKSFLFFLSLVFLTISCQQQQNPNSADEEALLTDTVNLQFTVEEAQEWTNLFKRNNGWFGADGIFAIPMNGVDTTGSAKDTETLLLFSDTMLGEIKDGQLQPGYVMINNSVATLKGTEPKEENIQFHWAKDQEGKPNAIFVPSTPNTKKGEYYWLGDGFVNHELDNTTYIFGYRIRNTGAAVFGFEEVGNTLIAIPNGSTPPFTDQRQMDTPFFLQVGEEKSDYGSFGAGIFVNTEKAGAPQPDGYVYVYGVRGKEKNVMAARVKPKDFENFDAWRFWDGQEWNTDMNQVAHITDRASNELSLTPLPDGRYALVFQTDGMGSKVGLRIGLSPVGPFGPIKELWDCKESEINKNFIVYNAKTHYNLSKKNELLISYNVNSLDFWNDIKTHPDLYRPRFIKVKFK
ncbi:DUF4185 domain-containing protein [Olivibacter sp. SDN3]|uniref:DUF4185 domain-containing protein n=1 Tax=Olivibacter sp. SDN3 TaxID=2764720 RepID=UPI0016519A0B|nr:DUF4185 domain-containing protein [Olivibacter sp. SDN3]QNL51740.1 DUF4185 domain-containing protein [Olivibacter sp. SDN3]